MMLGVAIRTLLGMERKTAENGVAFVRGVMGKEGIRLLGVGSPDGENTWWLEQHLENSGQRHYCISQGVLNVLYGGHSSSQPSP